MVAKHVNKKNAGKPRVLVVNTPLHLHTAFAATFSAVAGYPTLKRLHGKIWPRLGGLPGLADRATGLGGSPHLSCKMRLK